MTENVECRTCGDEGDLTCADGVTFKHCPDCTPENVEEPK